MPPRIKDTLPTKQEETPVPAAESPPSPPPVQADFEGAAVSEEEEPLPGTEPIAELGEPVEPRQRQIETVPIFRSSHAGYGDAYQVRENRYNRNHGSIDARWPGQIRMGRAIQSIATGNFDRVPVYAVEWLNSGNVQSVILIITGSKLYTLQYGALAEIQDTGPIDAWGATATHGALHFSTNFNTPVLFAALGGFTDSTGIETIAQNLSTFDKTHPVVADRLLSFQGALYRTLAPGNAASSVICQVSVCQYGSNPITASNWGTPIAVGNPAYPINAIQGVRGGVVVIKPDGIFGFSQAADEWINYMPAFERFTDTSVGFGSFSLGDAVVIPMGDGGAIIFDGFNATPVDPIPLEATPNLHTTPGSMITVNEPRGAMGTAKNSLLAVTPLSAKAIFAGTSLRFLSDISDSFTDHSAAVRDADLTTQATFVLDTADEVWIGWDRPFVSVHFATGVSPAVNNNAATLTVAVGQSGGGYSSVTFRDFSDLGGAPFGQNGHSIVLTQDPVEQVAWEQTTVNSITAYWWRITTSATLDSVNWANCRITPWYPSVDRGTNYPLDGLDRAGVLPHILRAELPRPGGKVTWHDMGSLPTPDEIGAILQCNVGGSSLNQSRQIVAIGRTNIYRIDVSPDEHPESEAAPFLNNVGLHEGSSFVPVPGKVVRLIALRFNGHQFDQNLTARFFYTWDYGKAWSQGATFTHAPAKFRLQPHSEDKGTRFHWSFGWTQAAVAARLTQPAVTHIEADFEVLADELDSVQERELATPPLF